MHRKCVYFMEMKIKAGRSFEAQGWLEWKPSSAVPTHPEVGAGPLRCVEHQSVPLPLHVVVLRLLGDVEAIKLQLAGQLLLPLKDHQGHLGFAGRQRSGRQAPQGSAASAGACGSPFIRAAFPEGPG